ARRLFTELQERLSKIGTVQTANEVALVVHRKADVVRVSEVQRDIRGDVEDRYTGEHDEDLNIRFMQSGRIDGQSREELGQIRVVVAHRHHDRIKQGQTTHFKKCRQQHECEGPECSLVLEAQGSIRRRNLPEQP